MKRKKKREFGQEHIFGVNPIAEAIRAGRRKVFAISIKKGASGKPIKAIIEQAKQARIPVDFASIDKVARMANAEGHQGIVAQVSLAVLTPFETLVEKAVTKPKGARPALCILDGVMDPRNLGAIIRSAEAFGFDGVIYPDKRAASYTPVSAKASAGAGEHMRLCPVNNVAEAIRMLSEDGFFCVALDGNANEDFVLSKNGPLALVLGGEGTGARPLVLKRCHKIMRIPIPGKVGSLNVSSAAAIAFHMAVNG